MEGVIFTVMGEPKGQPRPKATMRGRRAGVYDPETAKPWKEAVIMEWNRARGRELSGPLAIVVVFTFRPPKSSPNREGYHTQKPDLDNLLKSTMDALTDAGAWKDDTQVAEVLSRKQWGRNAGAHIEINQIKETEK